MKLASFRLILTFLPPLTIALATVPGFANNLVDNPKYLVWSKFKPGSSSTIEADIDQAGKHYHIKTIRTLISISDDNLVVETKSTATTGDNVHTEPAWQEVIPAKAKQDDNKQVGEKDIDAMGKSFKCKVFEAVGDSSAKPVKNGSGGLDSMRSTIYLSDDVPGGLVRVDGAAKDGKAVTFILTAMELK